MDDTAALPRPATGGEAVLIGLRRAGIDWLFGNAGTDFPPIIEGLACLPPEATPLAITAPHETAAVAMAHGAWLASGRMQAAMVHVNVGLANAAMGVINAASDDVPLLMLSGRTPLTETGRPGGRVTPIQYGQEMYHQASLVEDSVKFHYELRYPEQAEGLVARAAAIARSAPCGPVHLALPREPLTEAIPPGEAPLARPQAPATLPFPDPAAVEQVARWLHAARSPLILVQRGDPEGRLGAALAAFAARAGVGVVEPFTVRSVLATDHPCFLGHDPGPALTAADLVIALDCGVPWIERLHPHGARVVHVAPDPLFRRMPVRGYRTDLAVCADPVAFVAALDAVAFDCPGDRRAALADAAASRAARARADAEAGGGDPMSAEFLSLKLGEALGPEALVVSELGVVPGAFPRTAPNRLFSNPHSGGLGWGMPAALGAKLAQPDRTVAAVIGDGSYIFANPVACHQMAEALGLPILTVVKNNGMWNAVRRSVVGAYPQGAAAQMNRMPLTSLDPAPDYTMIAAASRAHVERVATGADLAPALARALAALAEGRQALLDVRVALSERY